MSSDGDWVVLTSTGGSSHLVTLAFFTGFERVDGPCDVLWLAEADPRLVTVPVLSLGSDRDDGCDAVARVGDCTCEVGVFGASLLD